MRSSWPLLDAAQKKSAPEIDAALSGHLETHGWAASLMPMGHGYETEWAVSFDLLGITDVASESGPIRLPPMAAKHMGGPPHPRPTWPQGVALDQAIELGRDQETVDFDVAKWGFVLLGS